MRYIPYTNATMHCIPQFDKLSPEKQHELDVVSQVVPFKTNNYVVDELIDWDHFADDPMFAMNFPWKEMIGEEAYSELSQLLRKKTSIDVINQHASIIKERLLPHSAPKATNLIQLCEPNGIPGLYHQYPHTLLAFTSGAATCHAYCTYCYRWMHFAFDDISFNYTDPQVPVEYLRSHPEISDVLFTGGDALHMTSRELSEFIIPLLKIESLSTIRLGTRTLTWWPYRFITDSDANDILAFFEHIIAKGKHLTLMVHISHPHELSTDSVQQAIRRIRSTGAVIRCQCPVVRRINDSKEVWIDLVKREISLGLVPYYMFVVSSKTSSPVFTIPLTILLQIYQDVQKEMTGLAKTLRGPVMTNGPFKMLLDGITDIKDEKVFVLKILQSTDANLIGKIVFAQYDNDASDLDQLVPVYWQQTIPFQ